MAARQGDEAKSVFGCDPDATEFEPASAGPAAGFPIVGIGASAGGLAAFQAFFSGLPADTESEMAFALVQHLAPDHKSMLAELIGRDTRMQVFEAEDGMRVKPNCVYIIPPNRDMACVGGALRVSAPLMPRGQRLPIDFFFRSLAEDQQERAIGIILSGSGSDGTLGIRAIKGRGGMAMAQNLESSEYESMPRTAINTGLVDYVLPPAEMPLHLMAYAARVSGIRRSTAPAVSAKEAELETSKEELQSLNEELATVNTELQCKVGDLSRVNNDMNNLLAGTGIGTVFSSVRKSWNRTARSGWHGVARLWRSYSPPPRC